MIPAGYMAKHVSKRPDWLRAEQVVDVYSVSGCDSEDFADYINFWRHNGFWLFDSPQVIKLVANDNSIDLTQTLLFYYEVYEKEFDGNAWAEFQPEPSFQMEVRQPQAKTLEGFDVVAGNATGHSPLSCNGLAKEIPTNTHCLLNSFDEAFDALERGAFKHADPGQYRIFAVYSVHRPEQ